MIESTMSTEIENASKFLDMHMRVYSHTNTLQ